MRRVQEDVRQNAAGDRGWLWLLSVRTIGALTTLPLPSASEARKRGSYVASCIVQEHWVRDVFTKVPGDGTSAKNSASLVQELSAEVLRQRVGRRDELNLYLNLARRHVEKVDVSLKLVDVVFVSSNDQAIVSWVVGNEVDAVIQDPEAALKRVATAATACPP